jgi:hypothetical protein
MAARGVKLWIWAELDHLRLMVKRLVAAKPAEIAPQEISLGDQKARANSPGVSTSKVQ